MSLKVFWAVIIFNLFGSIALIIIDCDSSDEACEITAYAITDDKQIENYPEDGIKLKARALRIRNSTMPKLPAGLVRIFPAIEELSVEETQLGELNFEDLKDFTKLTILSAPNNNLTEIADDLFQNLLNLEEIDFSNNKISKIGLKSLSKLESLKTFNLSGNICVDKVFKIKNDPERKLMIAEIYGKCPLESLMQRSLTNDDCQRENLLEYLGIEHESNCNKNQIQNEPQKQSDMGTPSCLLPSLPMDPSCVCVCIPNSYKSSLNLNAWRRIKDSQEFDLCPFKISQTNSLGGSIIFRPPSNLGQSPYNLSLFGIGTFPFEITIYPATSGSGSILVEKELIVTSTESWIPSIPDIQVTYPPPIFPTLPSHTYPPPLPEHTTKSSGGLIPPNNSPSLFPIPGTTCFSSPLGVLCTSNIPPSNLPNFPAPNYPPSNLPNFPAPNFPPQGPPFFPTPSPSFPNYPPQGPPFPWPGPWHNGMTPCELGTLIMNSNHLPNQIPAPVQQPNPLLQRSLMQPEQPSPFFQPFTFPPMEFPTFPSLIFPTFPTEPEATTNAIPVVNLPAIPTQVTRPIEIASQPQVINLLKEPETTESSSPDEIQLAVNPRLERRRAVGQALI